MIQFLLFYFIVNLIFCLIATRSDGFKAENKEKQEGLIMIFLFFAIPLIIIGGWHSLKNTFKK